VWLINGNFAHHVVRIYLILQREKWMNKREIVKKWKNISWKRKEKNQEKGKIKKRTQK
jgi:hypothetical protein